MITIKEYFEKVKHELAKTKEDQRGEIIKAAKMMGDCMENNGVVQLFGINHGLAFSMELGYRAGGLMPFHQFNIKDLALRGFITTNELRDEAVNERTDLVDMFWETYNIESTDMFVLVSHTGCEPLIVKTALKAKQEGHQVIAVVSKYSVGKNEGKQNIVEIADLVIDTCAPYNDVLLTCDNGIQLGQISTISGNVIAQMLTAETYNYLKSQDKSCPVLLSANTKGADVHNRALSDQYLGRWNS